MAISLRPHPAPGTAEPDGQETVDSRSGTSVAVGFPLLATLALGAWLWAGLPQPPLDVWTLFGLPLLCAVYGLFPALLDRRTFTTFERPTLLLAGLVGGPVAGVVAGVATGLGDVEAVWRRRAAFAGLAMLQGLAAGALGVTVRNGSISLAVAVLGASVACLAIGALGFAAVACARRCFSSERLHRALVVDAAELAAAAPLVFLLAQTFDASPAATSLAVASALALVGLGIWASTGGRAEAERERRAQLTDPLTGALSRAGFDEAIAAVQARVLRGEQPAGILVCDLDHFGLFNEQHGHLGGDRALRQVVARMKESVRSADVVARWGGDELCVLAPRVGTLEDVEHLAERIRRAVADAPLDLDGEQAEITVSVGGTLLVDWIEPDQAFARADEALYAAKRARNAARALPPPGGEPGHGLLDLGRALAAD